jgi:hypothetical protein
VSRWGSLEYLKKASYCALYISICIQEYGILVQFSIVKWNGAQNCVEYAQRLGSWATGLEKQILLLVLRNLRRRKMRIHRPVKTWLILHLSSFGPMTINQDSGIVLRSWLISWSKVTMMKHIGVCSLRLKVYFSAVVTHPTEATFNWATLRCCWEPSFEALSRRMARSWTVGSYSFFFSG